jgi:hypothetical protein
MTSKAVRHLSAIALSTALALCSAFAQEPNPDGWRRFGDGRPAGTTNYNIPPQLSIRQGTYLTVRINQPLSSDRNQPGDAFSATLAKPLVVDGIVIAERGQTIGGRVAEAQKAGRAQGVSRLGIELIDLTLVDGQTIPIQTQLVSHAGPTSHGQDGAAIATTTGTGAAIGAAVNGGVGAGVGAAAGLVAGLVGVLLTRGHSTVIYPESMLTFRIETPVTVSTERAPYAFRYMDPNDYQRSYDTELRARPRPVMAAPAPYPYPYYAGWGPAWPHFYVPSVSLFYGYGRHYGPRYYRRW